LNGQSDAQTIRLDLTVHLTGITNIKEKGRNNLSEFFQRIQYIPLVFQFPGSKGCRFLSKLFSFFRGVFKMKYIILPVEVTKFQIYVKPLLKFLVYKKSFVLNERDLEYIRKKFGL